MNTPPINLSISDELLRKELDQSSTRFHVIGAWVAIIFDPLFAVTDYFNIPNHWQQLLAIRLGISCILALALWAWKRKEYPSFYLVMLAFLLISLQNAYTFSLIGNDLLTGHCLNYMALLLGAAMFLLWSYEFSLAIVGISALATVYFVSGNPDINPDLFWVKGGLLLLVMGLFMILLIKARYDLTLKEI
ncbi:MAG TPA: hypothetical protein PLK63_00615, partial [Catalimonadaceae bacterium]|nr:hypothetical protein [Catalimonadaceae bacterium]